MKALLLLCALAAAQARRPLCPDGRPPALTGHPVRPAICGEALGRPPRPAALPEEASAPNDLAGSWHGWAYHEGERFAVDAEISPKERRLRWTAKSANTHASHELIVEARERFWSRKPPWKLTLRAPRLTDETLKGRLWLGADQAVWVFTNRAQEHRLEWTLEDPGKLKVRYYAASAGKEPYSLELTLTR